MTYLPRTLDLSIELIETKDLSEYASQVLPVAFTALRAIDKAIVEILKALFTFCIILCVVFCIVVYKLLVKTYNWAIEFKQVQEWISAGKLMESRIEQAAQNTVKQVAHSFSAMVEQKHDLD